MARTTRTTRTKKSPAHALDNAAKAIDNAKTSARKAFDTLVKRTRKATMARATEARDVAMATVRKARRVATAEMNNARARTAEAVTTLEKVFETRVSRAIAKLGVPTTRDVRALSRQVAELQANVERLRRSRTRARA